MTFALYAAVSTTIFNTFLCDEYGDDETLYLVADKRVDCNSDEHLFYKKYATFMAFVYPVGIPVLYYFLLAQHRIILKLPTEDPEKLGNAKLQKLSFLWDEYEPKVSERARRASERVLRKTRRHERRLHIHY